MTLKGEKDICAFHGGCTTEYLKEGIWGKKVYECDFDVFLLSPVEKCKTENKSCEGHLLI